jgi:hypothetical protein
MISKITPNLYIGEYLDVVGESNQELIDKAEALRTEGITHIVSLCSEGIEDTQIENEKRAYNYSTFGWYHSPVPLSKELTAHMGKTDPFKFGLELALYEVHRILYNNPNAKVLVHCTAGIDRSPFVVAAYLVRYNLMSLGEAYGLIKKVRPFVCEHHEWVWWEKPEPKQVSRVEVLCAQTNGDGKQ